VKDDYILIVDDELPIREMIHTSLDMALYYQFVWKKKTIETLI